MTPEGNVFSKPNLGDEGTWRQGFTRWALAVASGLMFAAAFPPWCSWGALPAFMSVLLLLYVLRGTDARRARAMGFVWGMLAFGVGLSWLWELFKAPAIGLWALLAVFIAAFAWLQSLAGRRGVAGWHWVGFTMVNWSGWEFIRCELFPLKFPWMTPGVACGPNVLLPWMGVYGVSALVVLLAAIVISRTSLKGRALWFGIAVLLLVLLGLPRALLPAAPGHSLKVALVQNEGVEFDQYFRQTAKLAKDVQLVVWPEYTIPYDVQSHRRDMARLQKMCRDRNVVLVLGTQSVPADKKGWFNTALTLDASGALGEHHKVHPVHFFDDGTPGTTALPVQTPLGLVGTPICFDCDYEGVVRRMTRAGAEFFAVPSMDAESWPVRQHEQHAALFRLRACENARWMVVCASSGVSQIIDPQGTMLGSLPSLTSGELGGILNRETRLTFYTRWGWLTPWVLLAAALVCWVAILPQRGRRR